jgi:IS4 transposase
VPFAVGPAEFSAALCPHRHGAGGRRQTGAGTVLRDPEGEIVIFDKAYLDFDHLWDLERRGVFWVTRGKENLQFAVIESYPVKEGGKIVSDELVGLKNAGSQKAYPELMRRIVAWVEVDGQERLMTFLTNNLTWSAESVAELYKCRWRIEVFFKQIKQTLQFADFLGTSANAVRWQIWTALLVYLLLRYLAFLTDWSHKPCPFPTNSGSVG